MPLFVEGRYIEPASTPAPLESVSLGMCSRAVTHPQHDVSRSPSVQSFMKHNKRK